MRRKQTSQRVNKFLKILVVITLIILLLLLLLDMRAFQAAIIKNLDKQNQTIHNLQLELETVKVTNVDLIKHIASQQVRISELEVLQTNTTEQLTPIEQPIVHIERPELATENIKTERMYLDYIPYEMITVVVSALELGRQMIMPKWNMN